MSRTYTRDEVQAVVNGMVGHPDCRTNGAAYDVGWDRCAREVLRRLDALPEASMARCACCSLPEGHNPGCPFGHRPRTPTPTPGVPPYAKQDGTRRAELTKAWDSVGPLPTGALASNESKSCPCPDAPAQHKFSCSLAQPTAPEVVWEGEGVRVLADGTWVIESPVPVLNVISTLTRALAEAIKAKVHAQDESAKLGPVLDVIREALKPYGCTFPGGGLVGIANGVDEVVHKAAESMRERASAQALVLAKSHVDPNVRAACERLVREIDALPLEEL